jgi:hypothetical protein
MHRAPIALVCTNNIRVRQTDFEVPVAHRFERRGDR